MPEHQTRLCCDVMVGKVARWLRLCGIDTFYNNKAEDEQLIKICQTENRILLTRDSQLAKKYQHICYFVQSVSPRQQLPEIITNLKLQLFKNPARCSLCNSALKKVEKETIKNIVPAYVFQTQEEFTFCNKCQKVYWKGTHWEKMLNFFYINKVFF